jgi:hypothetical protein
MVSLTVSLRHETTVDLVEQQFKQTEKIDFFGQLEIL